MLIIDDYFDYLFLLFLILFEICRYVLFNRLIIRQIFCANKSNIFLIAWHQKYINFFTNWKMNKKKNHNSLPYVRQSYYSFSESTKGGRF